MPLSYATQTFQTLYASLPCAPAISEEHKQQLCYALSLSDLLAETWQKQPDFFVQCLQTLPLPTEKTALAPKIFSQLNAIENTEEFKKILRQIRYREMATLSLCQSLNLISVEETLRKLSDLAECLILQARDWLYRQACAEMGTPTNAQGQAIPLQILAMGKLGGGELNFSSDIDLIFAFEEQGKTQGGRRCVENSKFFTRLGQRLIHALADFTPDGFVYRVDMRLRPFGEAGALALSYTALEQYYQTQGRDWERYAMLKARLLGESLPHPLQQMLRPFVYRRYIDFSVLQSLREMKEKIAREVRRRALSNNIKLGAGGIREIEFIVQVFQLIRGGREVSLQNPSLLQVLPKLTALQLITEPQEQALQDAYLFLRRTENVLQAIHDEQTQTLPENIQDKQRLMQACQYFYGDKKSYHYAINNWADFCLTLHQHQQNVRTIFNALIGEETPENSSEHPWQDFLEDDFSFAQEAQKTPALTHLLPLLADFKQQVNKRPIGQRGRSVLKKLFPLLLQEVLRYPDCAQFFPRIVQILENILTRTTYLELLLENPPALQQLIELCAKSKLIAEQVAQHPLLLDELLNRHALLNPPAFESYPNLLREFLLRFPPDDEELFLDALRQFKQSAVLKVAAADILGGLSVMKVSDHLTYLAQAILQEVVHFAWQQMTHRFGTPEGLAEDEKGLLVIAYGKLGGIELGYKSDLDVVFLFDHRQGVTQGGRKSIENALFYVKLTQKILRIFTMRTSAGILYDVDIRLRPEGDAGLVCCSLSSFAQYQQFSAWTWEKQALVRTRAIFGDERLKAEFNVLRQNILMQKRDIHELKQEVSAMREKMCQQENQHLGFHLKNDRGGIQDIEFIAQFLVLAYAKDSPTYAKWSDNVRIFAEIGAESTHLSQQECAKLSQIYTALRNQIHHQNLLGLPIIVDEGPWQEARAFILNIWQKLFA